MPTYKIHPGIGIARLGNSDTEFYLAPETPAGLPMECGGNHGTLTEIRWQVYVANKKACWYQFAETLGEHGYPPGHPRRNAAVTNRERLIIDPGPRTVDNNKRRAAFDRAGEGNYATTFPGPLS